MLEKLLWPSQMLKACWGGDASGSSILTWAMHL
jgi:hypothetical protein